MPLAGLFELGSRLRGIGGVGGKTATPLLCVANATLGGGGKTPLVAALAEAAALNGLNPQVIAHGYRASLLGGTLVDPGRHTAAEVGDEALELAVIGSAKKSKVKPTVKPTGKSAGKSAGGFKVWGGRKRALNVAAADAVKNTELLIMDDGLFDPSVSAHFAVLAVDGDYGFGNRRVVPAGPLRRSLSAVARRVDAVVVYGDGRFFDDIPHFYVEKVFRPTAVRKLKPLPTVAFAGISRPSQFFAMVAAAADLKKTWAFASHRSPPPNELKRILGDRRGYHRRCYQVVTTAKDYARLPPWAKKRVLPLPITLKWRPGDSATKLINMAL